MNPAAANSAAPATPSANPHEPAGSLTPLPPLPGGVVRGKTLLGLIALAFMVHLALVCFFGTRKQTVPRPVAHVPRLQLVNDQNPLLALEDPTLFALPNPRDFSAATWTVVPVVPEPSFRWSEPPRWLAADPESPDAAFNALAPAPDRPRMTDAMKPPPPFAETPAAIGGAMPSGSFLRIHGDLGRRGLLGSVDLPALPYDNVIPPSRVQVVVDPAGLIVSAILLPSTDSTEPVERCDAADQRALAIARQLHFAPASRLEVGEIDFYWQAVPARLNHGPAGL